MRQRNSERARALTTKAVEDLEPLIGLAAACRAVGLHRATWYRWRTEKDAAKLR